MASNYFCLPQARTAAQCELVGRLWAGRLKAPCPSAWLCRRSALRSVWGQHREYSYNEPVARRPDVASRAHWLPGGDVLWALL